MTVEQELNMKEINNCIMTPEEVVRYTCEGNEEQLELFIKSTREQVIKEVIEYLRQRKRNAKNLYKMDNVVVSPKIALSIVTKLLNDCEKKFLVEKEVKKVK